jgi:hypothetical protein
MFTKAANTACDRAKIKAIGNSKGHKEVLKGGKGDGKPDSEFDKKDLKKGEKHESEHTKNKKVQKEIAKDHLTEDPDYYKKLKKIEKKSFAAGFDKANDTYGESSGTLMAGRGD